MKALVYKNPHTLSYEDVDDPIPQKGEALVRIEYVGICGSDMHAYHGHDERRPAPLILGHEAAGVIVGGDGGIGRRVTINPLVTCQTCVACQQGDDNLCPERQIISMPPREGAFAELVSIPVRNLVDVPEDILLQQAALCEPIACGWSAAKKCRQYLGHRFINAKALVQGGGAIGVGAALSLRALGVENITLIEPHVQRATFIRQNIGFHVISQLPDQSMQFDLIIDGVGFEVTRNEASTYVRPGGVIAHIGLGSNQGGLDIRRITLHGISFIGCYTYSAQEFRETANAIFTHRFGALNWCDIRPLSEGSKAFHDIHQGKIEHPKLILKI